MDWFSLRNWSVVLCTIISHSDETWDINKYIFMCRWWHCLVLVMTRGTCYGARAALLVKAVLYYPALVSHVCHPTSTLPVRVEQSGKYIQNLFICTSQDTHLESRLGNPSNGTLGYRKITPWTPLRKFLTLLLKFIFRSIFLVLEKKKLFFKNTLTALIQFYWIRWRRGAGLINERKGKNCWNMRKEWELKQYWGSRKYVVRQNEVVSGSVAK
jgi:hypothetical protein